MGFETGRASPKFNPVGVSGCSTQPAASTAGRYWQEIDERNGSRARSISCFSRARRFRSSRQTLVMREYDLYVPLISNDGKRFPHSKLARLRKKLASRFGGLTYFPQRNKGTWRIGGATFRDEIVILRVLAESTTQVSEFWRRLKLDLQLEWRQKSILIVVRAVTVI